MMNNSLKNRFKVVPGTIIEGKWHRNRYTIVKELGYGANGTVFLAKAGNKHVALKLSDNGMSIISEGNVLKSFAKVQGSALGPSLLDVDDWETKSGKISFYAMEYIHGPDLLTFIQTKGQSWISILILQLLSDLGKLHNNGWVFGDLKPDNLIVTGPPPKIRCIDVGGTTVHGRAIKEFTEFYDRGYWGLGTRKADPQYDLFAVGMILMNIAYPKRFMKQSGGLQQLRAAIRKKQELHKYEDIILRALKGQYLTAEEMRIDLLKVMGVGRSKRDERQPVSASGRRHYPQQNSRRTMKKQKKRSRFVETILIVFVISLLYILYIFGQIF
ncbi:protein kinase domain-containing protein [Bacillus methanolicus]|nr:serine/threonine protein kinase [Bacillus methanolicus]EIJ84071.1 serine/threonine protein kinase [Bacillus methanolicus MGA3]